MQNQTKVAYFTGCFGSPRLGGGIAPGREGGDSPFHEPEFTFRGSLEWTEVPRFQAVAFQLHARPGHLERVFIELSVAVADQPEAEQRLQQRDTRTRLSAELLLAEFPSAVLELRGQFIRDDPRRHHHAGRQVFRALPLSIASR